MLQLALEIVLLVFVTAFLGLAAGFGAGKLRNAFSGNLPEEPSGADEPTAPDDDWFTAEPPVVRRIPDPAPPSELRRKRLLDDAPSGKP